MSSSAPELRNEPATTGTEDAAPIDLTALPAPPGPRGLPLVGVLPRIWRDPLGFFQQIEAEFGGLARFGNRKFTLYLLSDPDGIRRVLQDNARNYWKGEGLAAARTVMGSGLATSHDGLWRRQRRLMQPAFHPPRLHELLPLLRTETEAMVARWRTAAERGAPLDVSRDASNLVQTVIFRGLFGGDCDALDTLALGRALAVANDFIHRSAWSLAKLPAAVPTPRRLLFARAMRRLDGTVFGLIEARRARPGHDEDLLGRLLAARCPDAGDGMSDRQVRDEVMTMFVAGHDTTAAALTWAFHLLAANPSARDRIATEVAAVGDVFDPANLGRFDFTGRAVQEVLRLYPPGWVIVRTPIEPDALCGYAVPAGAPILISPWVVHRSTRSWSDPERFDPDRFGTTENVDRPRFAYLPYGGGTRKCIGSYLADLILRTVVGHAASQLRFEPIRPGLPTPRPRTTLQPARLNVRVYV